MLNAEDRRNLIPESTSRTSGIWLPTQNTHGSSDGRLPNRSLFHLTRATTREYFVKHAPTRLKAK